MTPIEHLTNEHRIIEQVLHCLQQLAEQANSQRRLDTESARDVLSFLRVFAECSHLAKEKAQLFPLLAPLDLPEGCDPTQLLLHNPRPAFQYLHRMQESIERAGGGNREALAQFTTNARNYTELVLAEFAEEEDCLFPEVDQALTEQQQKILAQRLASVDTDALCGEKIAAYIELANRLADRLGVQRAVLAPG